MNAACPGRVEAKTTDTGNGQGEEKMETLTLNSSQGEVYEEQGRLRHPGRLRNPERLHRPGVARDRATGVHQGGPLRGVAAKEEQQP